jgi:beta-galactosidase
MKRLAPVLEGTKVISEVCILYTHDNDWTLALPRQPNKYFSLREHIQLFYTALHDRQIMVDFARPLDDLSKYKLVIAPSLSLLSGAEADALRIYVQNGGTLVATCNTGLVDEHQIAADAGFPHDLTDVFGMEVMEFDPMSPDEENHMAFKGSFHTSTVHMARLWCDIIEAKGCQVLANFTKEFYAGNPAMTMNTYGLGKAIYIGTISQQPFYCDLVVWLRNLCGITTLLKVPENIEVSLRQKGDTKIFFLLNHQSSAIRINFFKPTHDFLTGRTFSGNFEIPAHGVLVLDENLAEDSSGPDQKATLMEKVTTR